MIKFLTNIFKVKKSLKEKERNNSDLIYESNESMLDAFFREVINTGASIKVMTGEFSYEGTLLAFDNDNLKLVNISVEKDEEDDFMMVDETIAFRTIWFINRAKIIAVGLESDQWSNNRFNNLIPNSVD